MTSGSESGSARSTTSAEVHGLHICPFDVGRDDDDTLDDALESVLISSVDVGREAVRDDGLDGVLDADEELDREVELSDGLVFDDALDIGAPPSALAINLECCQTLCSDAEDFIGLSKLSRGITMRGLVRQDLRGVEPGEACGDSLGEEAGDARREDVVAQDALWLREMLSALARNVAMPSRRAFPTGF